MNSETWREKDRRDASWRRWIRLCLPLHPLNCCTFFLQVQERIGLMAGLTPFILISSCLKYLLRPYSWRSWVMTCCECNRGQYQHASRESGVRKCQVIASRPRLLSLSLSLGSHASAPGHQGWSTSVQRLSPDATLSSDLGSRRAAHNHMKVK